MKKVEILTTSASSSHKTGKKVQKKPFGFFSGQVLIIVPETWDLHFRNQGIMLIHNL